MCLPGQQLDDIHTISSHPMALLQCERFLSTRKHWHIIHDVDTAGAAALISKQEKKGWAAIASRSTAKYYGLEILAEQIQDVKENYTRFYVLEKSDKTHHSQGNKIAMCFTLPHQVGALATVLACCTAYQLNLEKIQSLPIANEPWSYRLYVEGVTHGQIETLFTDKMAQLVNDFKVLEIYKNGK